MIITDYLNINAFFGRRLIHPRTKKQVSIEELSEIFSPSIAGLELTQKKHIDIPKPVLDIYSRFRPTPLFRAEKLEKAIGTNCEIFIKDEGTTPIGNHKANSAYLLAYLCKKDGFKRIITETTGNWGIALATAAKEFGLEVVCFLDEESYKNRQNRKKIMEDLGAKVVVVKSNNQHSIKDYLMLSANAAVKYTQNMEKSTYIFGSIYGYFIIPQSILGLEAKAQLEMLGKSPDIVIGCCGGGANFLGLSSPFLVDYLEDRKKVCILAAEAEGFPILSQGKSGYYSIDNIEYYPLLYTYRLERLRSITYVGGLGSTVVASAAAYFHSQGIIQTVTLTKNQALEAANLFQRSEGRWIALESSYAVAAAIEKAQCNTRKKILLNISSGDTDTQFYDNENV